MKRKGTDWEKYLQNSYLIKHVYTEYVKNSNLNNSENEQHILKNGQKIFHHRRYMDGT